MASFPAERNLYRARIHHQPYPIQRARLTQLDDTLVWVAGIRTAKQPHLLHYAREVNVYVYPLERARP